MAQIKKKVVLLIVEGDCEETLLIERLRELFKKHDIRFEPQRGDILFSFDKNIKPIKSIIGNTVKEILIKRKYKTEDILAVLHIIDTDGCFISNENVVIDDMQEILTFYKQDCISVPNEKQRNSIITRNETRSKNISAMSSVKSILPKKITYRMYYFSRNLEHVIFNEPNPNENTKLENVESFINQLSNKIEEYLTQFMPEFSQENYESKYSESWNMISNDLASLQRSTNVPLLFDFIHLNTN